MGVDLDWADLAGKVIGLGAPILGGALGGPLGRGHARGGRRRDHRARRERGRRSGANGRKPMAHRPGRNRQSAGG